MPLALGAALLLVAGCGDGGVGEGANVNVYVAAPLCAGAERALGERDAGGEVGVRAVCLDPSESADRLDLAAAGANARRASEDSTAVAYLEPPGPANPFVRPIVEEARIAWLRTESGAAAMNRVLAAVDGAGSGSLRSEVRNGLEGS